MTTGELSDSRVFDRFVSRRRDELVEELRRFVAIPSVASDDEATAAAAEFLRDRLERAGVAAVQVGDLLKGEVRERQAGADVEGRLVQVRDEEVGLGGVGDRQREARPGAARGQALQLRTRWSATGCQSRRRRAETNVGRRRPRL